MPLVREPVQVVRLTAPRCAEVFGVGACEATGTPCYNTDNTCKFRAALDLSETFTWDFVSDDAHPWNAQAGAYQPALAIPSLRGYQIAPTVLNVAGGTEQRSGVGQRAVCTVRLADHTWNDRGDDPYPADRATDALSRGTFWPRWLARHPYHGGYRLEVFEGERGQPLAEMTRRVFEVERISADRGGVTVVATDPLSRVTDRALTVPARSPGELATDLGQVAASIAVVGAVAGDYDPAGLVRIGAEVIGYTDRAALDDGTILLSGLSRGRLGTRPTDHEQFARVQRVAFWENVLPHELIDDLLTAGGVSSDLIDLPTWEAEVLDWRAEYRLTLYLTEALDLRLALGSVLTQSLLDLWYDERAPAIRLRAQRPQASVPVLTEDGDIVADTLAIDEHPEDQVTRVSVYFDVRDWTASLTAPGNFARVATTIDLLAEQRIGRARERAIFAPAVGTLALAATVATAVAARFADVPLNASFDLAREDQFWTGDLVRLWHALRSDADGLPEVRQFVIISAESDHPGGRVRVVARNADVVGSLWAWVDDDVPAFDDATVEQRASVGYLTDDDGLLPDATKSQFGWL